jgi:hypothetical protein
LEYFEKVGGYRSSIQQERLSRDDRCAVALRDTPKKIPWMKKVIIVSGQKPG